MAREPEKEDNMSLVRTAKESTVTTVPPGTYHVRCIEVRPDQLENPQFGDGAVIRFELEVVDQLAPDGSALVIDAIANDRLTPKSKLWGWLEAFGITPQINGDVDIEACVYREAMARIVKKPESEFTRVDELFPLPSNMAKPSASKADGEPDFTGFWAQIKAMGKSNADVIPLLPSKKLTDMPEMSGADLVAILEKLSE